MHAKHLDFMRVSIAPLVVPGLATRIVGAGMLAFAAVLAFDWPAVAVAQSMLAARVNGAGIPLELLDRQFEELLRERKMQIARLNNPARAKAMKREALDYLIRIELLWQEAKRAGLAATNEEVDRAIAEARGRFRTHDAFVRRVEQGGFTEESYREHTRKVLSADRIADRMVERDVQVTDKDIEDFYAANPRLFRREEQLKARHILVAVFPAATAEQRAEALRRIETLLLRANAGERFEQLARQHSDDATRQWGGELDPFSRGDMPKPFEEAAFALKPGEISAPVETAAGFHLIQLQERMPSVSVPLQSSRESIREHLRVARGREAIDRHVQALRALGKVEVLTPL